MKYIKWTYDKCEKEALKYETRREFAINSGSAYNYARQNNIIDEITHHMKWKRKPSGYWTYDKCEKEALKYETRNEYRINSGSSYDRALKNNWLDSICSHMKTMGNRNNRCIYAYEFSDKSVYIGLTHNINERHKNRICDETDSVNEYIKKTNLMYNIIQLTNYIDYVDASKLEGEFLEKYRKDGWNILNKVRTGNVGGNYLRWTKEKCIECANNCNSKKEFYSKYRGAYISAQRNNWISEIYLMFNSVPQKKNFYTFEYCKNEALKYITKKEFKKNNRGAYEASLRNGWHDKLCLHMR